MLAHDNRLLEDAAADDREPSELTVLSLGAWGLRC